MDRFTKHDAIKAFLHSKIGALIFSILGGAIIALGVLFILFNPFSLIKILLFLGGGGIFAAGVVIFSVFFSRLVILLFKPKEYDFTEFNSVSLTGDDLKGLTPPPPEKQEEEKDNQAIDYTQASLFLKLLEALSLSEEEEEFKSFPEENQLEIALEEEDEDIPQTESTELDLGFRFSKDYLNGDHLKEYLKKYGFEEPRTASEWSMKISQSAYKALLQQYHVGTDYHESTSSLP